MKIKIMLANFPFMTAQGKALLWEVQRQDRARFYGEADTVFEAAEAINVLPFTAEAARLREPAAK